MDTSMEFSLGLSQGVAWHWPIAVYLFFAGISGGALTIALGMRFYLGQVENTGLFKAAALISLVTISLGMLCLVLDLTNPLFFWRILVFYNFHSVMSIGVAALSLYIPLVAVMALFAFEKELMAIPQLTFLKPIIAKLHGFRRPMEALVLVLALSVCAYTGFL
ncbi:MAG: NrfD/PsrC family molybdoenzyme membrane anchor subunit, partial [Shewanella sp.]